MIKIKRSLDIHTVLQSHSHIVHDEKRTFGAPTRSVFTSTDLINWLLDNHNPTNTDKEGLEKLVNEELVDPTLPHQLMYPVDMGIMDSKKKFYRFIEDQFIEFKKDSTIINLHGLDTSVYQFFYEQQEELSVFKVMEELGEVLQNIFSEFVHENGTKIDYDGLVDSELFNLKYLPLATKLAYLDLSPLIANDNQLKAFFINVYNAFAIHVMLARYGHKKKLDISTLERLDTFNTYKYCIGGHNYTLNDIYQGILRGNDAAGSSVGAAAMQFMFKVKSKTPRFKENDPRYKFVVRNFDPRIHFALNYGAISCPPLRLYTAIDIDEQLEAATKEFVNKDVTYLEVKTKKYVCMSQIFKYYCMDFGNNNEDILRFLGKYIEREVVRQEILAAAEKPNSVNCEFQKFDINTNIYKPEKKVEPVAEEKEKPVEEKPAAEESAEKPAEK